MRRLISLGLLMLTVPAAALAGNTSQDSRQLVCVKKPAEHRVGQRAAPSSLKCHWVQRIPSVVDPTPIFIL